MTLLPSGYRGPFPMSPPIPDHNRETVERPGLTRIPRRCVVGPGHLIHPAARPCWRASPPTALIARHASFGFMPRRPEAGGGAGYSCGPRIARATRAIVATAARPSKGFAAEMSCPQGAEEADGR